jgi:hypothetical protein
MDSHLLQAQRVSIHDCIPSLRLGLALCIVSVKSGFKFANTSLNIWMILIKNSIIFLILNAPTSSNHYLHKEIQGHPLFSIIHHLMKVHIHILVYTKCPPEALTGGTLEKGAYLFPQGKYHRECNLKIPHKNACVSSSFLCSVYH